MSRSQCALLCALLALSTFTSVHTKRFGGRGSSHSYPHSGGLSGSSHSRPPGGSHGYPSSGGLSGTGSHGYPSSGGYSGGSHGYPSSGGLSGSGSKPGYPNTGNHPSSHPSSNHGYPAGNGLSGNSRPNSHTTINNNYHYHYSPPQQIRYQPAHGPPTTYPVYHGTPPTYVYNYQNSGSKYSSLLAGLALFNLGALAGTAYGHYSHTSYKPKPGEVCKFGIRKENGDYEETRIDCQLITSFIFQAEASQNHPANGTSITTTVTNTTTTIMNTTNNEVPAPAAAAPVSAEPTPNFTMLPNGTLVPVALNETAAAANVTATNVTASNVTTPLEAEANKAIDNTMTSSVVVTSTTTNTTVTNAVDVKGPPVDVTPGMKCYIIRNSPTSNMKKTIPCGLLQTYAQQSLKKNSAVRRTPLYTLLAVAIVAYAL